jgi:2-polyprenyl-3-methyl-5-hydroxy-6-metoxy-1,4-benzoquinol methylase
LKYFNYLKCPICNHKKYDVYIESKYSLKKINNKSYLKKIYSSSSSILLDQVVRCLNCNYHYINPRPKTEIILQGYSEVEDQEFITQASGRIQTFKNSLKIILKNINKKELKLGLDVGSASGEFLYACKNLHINCEGIEPSKWLVKLGKRKYNIKVSQNNFLKLNNSKKYNFISFWDVLEHVTELHKAKLKILKLLKKDGFLFINVPDIDSFAKKILGKNWPFFLSVHLHYLNKSSLLRLFGKEFDLVFSKPHWQILELEYVFDRAIKYFPFLKIFKIFIKIFKIGKIKLKYNMGQTLFVFKKKK